jgi:beta-glucosidase
MSLTRSLRIAALICAVSAAGFLINHSSTSAASPKRLSSFDPEVKRVLAKMTLDEKVGQMTQPDQEKVADLSDIENLFLGSVLSGGDSDPKAGNTLQAWTDLYDSLQKHTEKTRLKIPLLYGVDALHGHNNVLGAVIFPHNIGLGCTRNAALVERIGRITAEEVRATGIQWTFAPCVTVPQDQRWGRTYEGFSEDPTIVAPLGEAAVRGLQGNDLASPLSLLACAKHYIGDGGTTYGSTRGGRGLDQGDARVDEATLRRIHLPGYIAAVKAGVGTIMPSYSSWNGVKCSASKRLLTEILKQELGFEGFLISDYSALDQIDPDYKKAVGISITPAWTW